MSILTEIQSLSPSALVELFEIDLSRFHAGIMRFHAGTNSLKQPVIWQGETYVPMPIEAEGFEIITQGTLPRPKMRIANINGLFSSAVKDYDDLVGSKVIRRRTFARYLDADNFPDAKNPEADPNQYFPEEIWYVEQKRSENRYVIEWELSSAMDLEGVMLPRRQVIQSACTWIYRSPECGYTGYACFDKNDQPCGTKDDFCAKRLSSCKKRFSGSEQTLPYGGFPGAMRYGSS